jgi:hypothetical protein
MPSVASPQYDVSFLDEIANADPDDIDEAWIHLAKAVLGPSCPFSKNLVLRVFLDEFFEHMDGIISECLRLDEPAPVELVRWVSAARLLPADGDVYNYVDEDSVDDPCSPE